MSLRKTHCVNRTMRRKTFNQLGVSYVSELSLQNVKDLKDILRWNIREGILLYRMSSDMFPWMSEWQWAELPGFNQIKLELEECGQIVKDNGMRVSFHPGHFNSLGSNTMRIVENTIIDLTKHGEILDMMGLPQTHYYPINIHVNAANPSREHIAKQFCDNFKRLPKCVTTRLTVENDDKVSQYTPLDLYQLIWQQIGTPITFDQFHYTCGRIDMTMQGALELSLSTWGGVTPLTHHSSPRYIEANDPKIKKTAHADFIYQQIESFGHEFDTDLEAKAKELAVKKYLVDFT